MFPGVTAVTNHLARHHKDIWEAYVLTRDAKKNSMVNVKKEERENCDMENADIRFTDLRSNFLDSWIYSCLLNSSDEGKVSCFV